MTPILTLVVLSMSPAEAEEVLEFRRSPTNLRVRVAAALDAAPIGMIEGDASFVVRAHVPGDGCGGVGWGSVAEAGFACLENTTLTSKPPTDLPRLLSFVAPSPADFVGYVKTGLYPEGASTPLVPYIYGKRWGRWKGRVWKSVEAYIAGEPPVDRLDTRHTYSFVATTETEQGRLFLRPNGSVVPAGDLFLYAVTSFAGRDMKASPPAAGKAAAWVVVDGARVRSSPSISGALNRRLSHHQPIDVAASPGEPGWWKVADGYVHGSTIVRWIPADRPEGVATDALWIDIDLGQQTLALIRGDTPEYVTLISGGVKGHPTPAGTFNIYDKAVTWDMASLEGADDAYQVDEVPWVMHFKPRYAIHAAFWHWGFGRAASHGCVNLAPRDARYVFERVQPALPPGFSWIGMQEGAVGTVVRIRE